MRDLILVIDDTPDRRTSYQNIAAACHDPSLLPSFEIELIFADDQYHAEHLLRHNSFSAIILDIVLENWNREEEKCEAKDLLALIKDDKIPVILISSQWYSPLVKNLVADFPTKNIRMFIHWEDLQDPERIEGGSIRRFMFTLAKYIEDYKNTDYSLRLKDDDQIRILHLSDLQFGGHKDWKQKLDIGHCVNAIEEHWGEGPTFIAITGDIAQRGLPEEYDAAFQWLSNFVAYFSWPAPSNRILVVPGNHDICLPLASSPLLALQESKKAGKASVHTEGSAATENKRIDWIKNNTEKIDGLIDYAFRPFLDFCSRLAIVPWLKKPEDKERWIARRFSYPWLESRFRHLGIAFFGFNTAQPIVPRLLPKQEVPKVTAEDISAEARNICKSMESPPLFIGLTHHYPLPGQKDLAIDQPENLNQLYTDIPQVALWLHGHWHQRETTLRTSKGTRRLVINSFPSLTVKENHRPPDSARGFSMLELERKDHKVTGCTIFSAEYVNDSLESRRPQSRYFTLEKDGYFQQKVT